MSFIKKHYKILIGIVILCLLAAPFLGRATIKVDGFNVDNVYETIEELSSDKYEGRRYGTIGNEEAVKWVEEQFKSIGLEPAGEDSTYRRTYTENTRGFDGVSALEVLDSRGRPLKSYKYGEDFKEQSFGLSTSGEFTGKLEVIAYSGRPLKQVEEDSLIAVVKEMNLGSFRKDEIAMAASAAGYSAVIYVMNDGHDFRHESASLGGRSGRQSGYELPTLITNERVFRDMEAMVSDGASVRLKSAFTVGFADVSDVMGMIPAENSGDYLFITAHIDHVGPDSDGTIYPGALDNASGVASMLEIARFIKSQGVSPEKNIVFIAFNGEEGGLIGSHGYTLEPLYPIARTTVLNLDMLGSPEDIPLTLMYYSIRDGISGKEVDASAKMRHHLMEIAKRLDIETAEANDPSSDHTWFGALRAPAITFIDYQRSKIHTPADDMSNISRENIDRALQLVISYVSVEAFSNMSAAGYSIGLNEIVTFLKVQYPFLLAFGAVLLAAYVFSIIRKKRGGNKPLKVPAFSLLLFIISCGIISYFPVKYPYSYEATINIPGLVAEGIMSILKSAILLPMYLFFMVPGLILLLLVERRINSHRYTGTGKEVNMAYPIAMVSVIVTSFILPYYYSSTKYMMLTPDFARFTVGRILTFAAIGGIAYLIMRLIRMERDVKTRSFKAFVIFSLVYTMLVFNFYMPIITDKSIIYKNAMEVSISTYSDQANAQP